MAINTEQQNFDELVALKEVESDLAGLTSPSKTSQWGFWLRLWAGFLRLFDLKAEAHKAEVTALANQAYYATPAWWVQRLLEFQYGDPLQVTTNTDGTQSIGYTTLDETKRIIVRAAAVQAADGTAVLKMAKYDTDGETLIAPSLDEQSAISAYIRKIKPMGTKVSPLYKNADTLRYFGTVYYDAIYTKATVKAAVEAAIKGYLAALPFDGSVDVQQIESVILAVPGVETVATTSAQVKPEGGTFNPFNPRTRLLAGYTKLDESPNDLSATITYADASTL